MVMVVMVAWGIQGLWDLVNTNGTILNKETLPSKISDVILDCYNFNNHFWSFTSQWQGLEKEIINSYISVILFTLGKNLLGKSAELECRGPPSKTSIDSTEQNLIV